MLFLRIHGTCNFLIYDLTPTHGPTYLDWEKWKQIIQKKIKMDIFIDNRSIILQFHPPLHRVYIHLHLYNVHNFICISYLLTRTAYHAPWTLPEITAMVARDSATTVNRPSNMALPTRCKAAAAGVVAVVPPKRSVRVARWMAEETFMKMGSSACKLLESIWPISWAVCDKFSWGCIRDDISEESISESATSGLWSIKWERLAAAREMMGSTSASGNAWEIRV